MTLANDLLQLEFQAAQASRLAYQAKVRVGKFKTPNIAPTLAKAYTLAWKTWTELEPPEARLATRLALYRAESDKHFGKVKEELPQGRIKRPQDVDATRWKAARGGKIGELANGSDAFVRYWLMAFGNQGVLDAGVADSRWTRKYWLAMNDHRTSDICYHLNGEIQPIEADFSWANFTGPAPPAHFVAAA